MFVLLTDETNKEQSTNVKFFVYGGIFFPISQLSAINNGIAKIRKEIGYAPGQEFKFNTLSRPSEISIEKFTEAKNKVIELCLEHDVRFIAYVIHHSIIKNKNTEEKITMAADSVIGRFNYFLTGEGVDGICIVDNLPEKAQWNYLSEKFQNGLSLPEEARFVPLERIQLFGATCINASHVNSAMDIILGAFRYSINNPKNRDAASLMMKKVASMMWGRGERLREYGFILRPKEIQKPYYKAEYETLVAHLNSLIS